MSFHAAGNPVFIYKYEKDKNSEKAEDMLLKDTEEILKAMEELLQLSCAHDKIEEIGSTIEVIPAYKFFLWQGKEKP